MTAFWLADEDPPEDGELGWTPPLEGLPALSEDALLDGHGIDPESFDRRRNPESRLSDPGEVPGQTSLEDYLGED